MEMAAFLRIEMVVGQRVSQGAELLSELNILAPPLPAGQAQR
jgi:hypothetical protein